MKRLLLLRHAKSSWGDSRLADFERPLNERGLRAAPLMGRYMRERKIRPDLIICSPAERARQTAALLAEAAGLSAPLRYDERIYEATAARLAEVISQADERAGGLLLGETRRMPTAALACVQLDADKWAKLAPHSGRLEWHVKPKELENSDQ
jgi:phosphohistidine phosphatase